MSGSGVSSAGGEGRADANVRVATERAQRRAHLTGAALANLAPLTWATNMTLGRWLRGDVGPLTLAAGRFLVASLCLAALLQRQPASDRRVGSDRWLLLGMALSGVAIFAPTLYLGLRFTTTVNATLIQGLSPIITGLLAALLIREPMSSRQAAGAIAGLMGVLVLISGGSLTFWRTMRTGVGDLIVLGSAALWGLYSVLGRQVMRHRSPISATAFATFLGVPLLLAAAVWEMQIIPPSAGPRLILAILYIGIVPSVVGHLAWNTAVRQLGASGAMLFYNTLPLYGTLLGYLFLGEPIGVSHLLGGALIVGGGLWAAREPSSSD
jgi:drug/metabolite transporter (DMT)-like permease